MTQLNKEVISKGSKIRLRSWLKILKTSNYIEKSYNTPAPDPFKT